MDSDAVAIAGRCHRALDPLHSLINFVPEAQDRLTAVGLRPGRMCYFASRSAPLGAVGPGTVTATFYNFNPEFIARYIPRAWTLADPERVVEARVEAADAALRRLLGDVVVGSPEVAELAELTRAAALTCTPEGRPLYAANAELDWPSEPHVVLWHAITLLREHRGDGHLAALLAGGLSGIEALVTHTATGRGFLEPAAKATRGWSDEQWSAAVAALRERGIVDDDGLTEAGVRQRERIEQETDRMAAGPWRNLGADAAARVVELGKPLSHRVIAAGAFPAGVFATR